MKPFVTAVMALSLLAPVGAEAESTAAASEQDLQISRANSRPVNTAPTEHFTGTVRVEILFTPEAPARASAGSVTFSPGARTNWHTQSPDPTSRSNDPS